MSNSNALIIARLDGDFVNQVDGSTATLSPSGGPSTAQGVRRTAPEFDTSGPNGTGDKIYFDVDEFNTGACTLALTIKTLQAFTSALNANYPLIALHDANNANNNFRIDLNYTDASGYNGIEAIAFQSGGAQSRGTVQDLDLADDTGYHIAVTFSKDDTTGNKTMAIYLNGRMMRGFDLGDTNYPNTCDRVTIGNLRTASWAFPCMCIIEDVMVYNEALDGDAIYDLWVNGLDEKAAVDADIYESQKAVVGYKRITPGDDYVPVWYDESAGRLWAFDESDSDQVWHTDDEGETWSLFHDFNSGVDIRAIFTWKENVYVSYNGSIQRSSKTTASFSEVLSLGANAHVRNWTVAIKADDSVLAVAEYEEKPVANLNAVYTTETGNSGEWTSRKTIVGNEDHWHGLLYDSNNNLWAANGDTASRIYVSDDDGATWTTVVDHDGNVPLDEEQVIEGVELPDGRIIWGSDQTTSRAHLGQYEPSADAHPWTAVDTNWSRVNPVTGSLSANIFGIYYDDRNEVVWYHAHKEGAADPRVSSIWLMGKDSRAPVLAENLGTVTWARANKIVATPNYIWHYIYKWPRTAQVYYGPGPRGAHASNGYRHHHIYDQEAGELGALEASQTAGRDAGELGSTKAGTR